MDWIFISYRRSDSLHAAARLHERLKAQLANARVFIDVDEIEPGIDFKKKIEESISACSVVIALIGQNWIDARDGDGHRRLENQDDLVRLELAAALQRDIRVIPIMLDGANLPVEQKLPLDLRPLARRHGLTINHGQFDSDVDLLVRKLKRILEKIGIEREAKAKEEARKATEEIKRRRREVKARGETRHGATASFFASVWRQVAHASVVLIASAATVGILLLMDLVLGHATQDWMILGVIWVYELSLPWYLYRLAKRGLFIAAGIGVVCLTIGASFLGLFSIL